MTKSNEFDRIKCFIEPLTRKMSGAFALQDDAAELDVQNIDNLIVTTDTIVEGIHFLGTETPASIARKLLSVNVSDLAAKGAQPYAYSLSLGLPSQIEDQWLEGFFSGLLGAQNQYGINLIGGDSVTVPDLIVLTITAMGINPDGGMIKRSGAAVGDLIYVTGTIGDGALGLLASQGKINSNFLENAYMEPVARIDFIEVIKKFASASMDISDGLVGDCLKLVTSSNVSAHLYQENIPLSEDASFHIKQDQSLLKVALTGGDDYQLLFTVPEGRNEELMLYCIENQLSLTTIGNIVEKTSQGVVVFDRMGQSLTFDQLSFSHT